MRHTNKENNRSAVTKQPQGREEQHGVHGRQHRQGARGAGGDQTCWGRRLRDTADPALSTRDTQDAECQGQTERFKKDMFLA